MDALVGGHGIGRVDFGVVGRPTLGTLGESEYEHRPEMAGKKTQDARTHIGAARFADVVAEQGQPVLLVAALGGGQCQQDVALLAGAPTGQVPVHGGFGALVGQVLAPPPKISWRRSRPVGVTAAPRVHRSIMGPDLLRGVHPFANLCRGVLTSAI